MEKTESTQQNPNPRSSGLNVGDGGNKYALKLRTPEEKQAAYKSYCDHIAAGYAKKSWDYVTSEGKSLTWETMEKYLLDEREFDPYQKKRAEAQSLKKWETVLHSCADGTNEKANVAALQIIMRNKFGWDKKNSNEDSDQVRKSMSHFEKIYQFIAEKRSNPADHQEEIENNGEAE